MALIGLKDRVQYIQATPPVADIPAIAAAGSGVNINASVGGEPMRIIMLAAAGAVGIAVLRWAGFRFNVGVA